MFEEHEKSNEPSNIAEENVQIPTEELNKIEEDILAGAQKLEAEIASIKELLLREKAENDNLRKRFTKELEDSHKYAITSFARDTLEIAENLQRAIDTVDQSQSAEDPATQSLLEGVKMTQQSLQSIFSKYGITRIHPLDEPFDHNFHQAILQVPTADKEPGICVQVIQSGYVIKERLLRPALVAVTKPLD